MSESLTESELRDRIAEDPSILEAGLVLLNKEQFIPNELGTRSFIDLYATDKNGHHVLIELKRSDAAARQAIHEIHKYVEGVKSHFSARDDEIRVIIASTTWRELLVPFSRLVADSHLALQGLNIEVTNSAIRCSKVNPLPINGGRFIAPWADLRWFKSQDELDKALELIKGAYKERSIEDYVILLLTPADWLREEQEAVSNAHLKSILSSFGEQPSSEITLPDYKFVAYVAIQVLSEARYIEILQEDKENWAEVQEFVDDMEGEEKLCLLHESALDLRLHPDGGWLELGYPAKLSRYLDDNALVIHKLLRFGSFARNATLTDEKIIAELRGESGSSGQRLKRSISVSNKAHLKAARDDIRNCLANNPVWSSHLQRHLDEIVQQFPGVDVDLSVFAPSTGALTIYYAVTRDQGALYVPTYSLLVKNPKPVRLYFGALSQIGESPTFQSLLDEFYQGELQQLLFGMTWGGYEDRDIDVLQYLGLGYKSFRCDLEGDNRQFHALIEDRWEPCDPIDPISAFGTYLENSPHLVEEIAMTIGNRDHGGMVDLS